MITQEKKKKKRDQAISDVKYILVLSFSGICRYHCDHFQGYYNVIILIEFSRRSCLGPYEQANPLIMKTGGNKDRERDQMEEDKAIILNNIIKIPL